MSYLYSFASIISHRLHSVFIIILFCCVSFPLPVHGDNPLSGSYSAVISGMVDNNCRFVRLSQYSFRPDMTFREDFWFISSCGNSVNYTTSSLQIGELILNGGSHPYPCYTLVKDTNYRVPCISNFKNPDISVQTCDGTYTYREPGFIELRKNQWPITEKWKLTWADPRLTHDNKSIFNKLELISASYFRGPVYCREDGSKNNDALNAGWALGASGVNFEAHKTIDELPNNFSLTDSIVLEFNPRDAVDITSQQIDHQKAGTTITVGNQWFNIHNYPKTTTGVRRWVSINQDLQTPIFTYVGIPPISNPEYSRTIFYANGHDFIRNHALEPNEGPHLYSGLQILDSEVKCRGYVFMQCQEAEFHGHKRLVGAIVYLDTPSAVR